MEMEEIVEVGIVGEGVEEIFIVDVSFLMGEGQVDIGLMIEVV